MANANLGIDLLLDDGDLVIAPTGDLAVTPAGTTCLLQDLANLLDSLPGDLYGHAEYGAGVTRLVGEEDRPDFKDLVMRSISDALLYDDAVGPRIEPESVRVEALPSAQLRSASFRITFMPLGEEWTTPLNLVWRIPEAT